MYVVGAGKLRGYWDKHPDAETSLCALYALLCDGAWTTPKALATDLGGQIQGAVVEVTAGSALIRLKVHGGAEVVMIDSILARKAG